MMLLLSQLQLVWLAEQHDHGTPFIATGGGRVISSAAPRSHPLSPNSNTPCVVCQIVKQSAARPSRGTIPLEPQVGVLFHPVAAVARFLSSPVLISSVRAPPLS